MVVTRAQDLSKRISALKKRLAEKEDELKEVKKVVEEKEEQLREAKEKVEKMKKDKEMKEKKLKEVKEKTEKMTEENKKKEEEQELKELKEIAAPPAPTTSSRGTKAPTLTEVHAWLVKENAECSWMSRQTGINAPALGKFLKEGILNDDHADVLVQTFRAWMENGVKRKRSKYNSLKKEE